ncbi:hypothetical protein PBCVAN69C_158L [Paramecium bursaria Chlorella virus AN69C]|uniref:Uncharacterized protein n=1 Tax=Paramecium bursaria Chlorella virus IL3A TaxID=46019 RepID=M1H533_PBCVI|nr:hypothetical protein PBCVAN69C_158L [Paramecium bursaria Chlorella virus AN69C]AGE53788.1 hypothetical protein PBCVIL3A_155L [Paramecium bursaria Chlorella virus IL3A]AGE57218.1 hypothetical protein PBCVNEJV4_164L [Paramecium bursaria Chlorella virus NE-JV-4]
MKVQNTIVYIVLLLIVVVIIWNFTRKEGWSDYNAPNDFMKIYYSNIVEDPNLAKKFPFFGTGPFTGLRCRKPNNVGCNTTWVSGQLVELTPKLKEQIECKFGIRYVKT